MTNTVSANLALNIINKLKVRNKLIRIADASAGAGIPSESTNLVTSQIMTKTIKGYVKQNTELSNQLWRKLKLGLRRTPDKPPEQRRFPNPAYGTTYARQMSSFRTNVARRELCTLDLCHLCKQTGHWWRHCLLSFKQGINAHGKSSATEKPWQFKCSR